MRSLKSELKNLLIVHNLNNLSFIIKDFLKFIDLFLKNGWFLIKSLFLY